MPEDVAPALVNALLKQFPARTSYSRSDFQASPMPGPVSHFLERRLNAMIDQEKERFALKHLTWADNDHPDVRTAHRTLQQVVEQHARIPQTLWEKELTQAVHRTMHYLVRPVPTVVRFIYIEEEPSSLPAKDVLDRFAYFSPYSYLREAARAYISQRNLEKVDRTRLATLLTRVDQQMTEDYSPEQWEKLLAPLFEMARGAFEEPAIPAHQLEEFFRNKDQSEVVSRLQTSGGMIDREALRALFRVDQEVASAPTPESHSAPEPPATSTSSSSPPLSDDGDEEAVPLWKQFQQSSSATTATAVAADESEEHEARPRWADFQPEPKESATTAPLDTLEQEVFGRNGASNRNRYIRELFDGSEDEYRKVLGTLRQTDSWNEASQVIARDVFRKHQVNIYSDPAVSFTNAVESGYE